MRLLNQNGQPNCLLYAFAMALDVDPDDIVKYVGYTGLEKVNGLDPPHCYRSHHIQEMIEFALSIGYSVTQLSKESDMCYPGGSTVLYTCADFKQWIRKSKCAVLVTHDPVHPHAYAWNGSSVLDSGAYCLLDLEDVLNQLDEAFLINQIKF